MKKKETKKKWNDAYRKRIKEIKIRSILDKQRKRDYYRQNRSIILTLCGMSHNSHKKVLKMLKG